MKKLFISVLAALMLATSSVIVLTGCGGTSSVDVVNKGLSGSFWYMDQVLGQTDNDGGISLLKSIGMQEMYYLYFDDNYALLMGNDYDYTQSGNKFTMDNGSISGEIQGNKITLIMGNVQVVFVRNTGSNAFLPTSLENTVWTASKWGINNQNFQADESTRDYIIFKNGYATMVDGYSQTTKTYQYDNGVVSTGTFSAPVLGNKMLMFKSGSKYVVYEKCTDQNKIESLIG